MSRPTFVTWLWNARGGWRHDAGYTPAIIRGVQYMLTMAVPGCRHICIADTEYHAELERLEVEPYPLWDVHGRSRTDHYGFDCNARLGLWGEPGERLAAYLNTQQVQWLDADVMIRRGAAGALLDRWDEVPEMWWVPRTPDLPSIFKFGHNVNTWLGVNGSMVRLVLGSRPAWWEALKSPGWLAETEARICGSDQAAMTRLLLESRGQEWRTPNQAIFEVPRFGDKVQPWGQPGQWDVAFFPYDPFTADVTVTDYTKPWLSNNAYLRREWRVLSGIASEDEVRAETHPSLRRYLRRG
jgi:hypothetical protein